MLKKKLKTEWSAGMRDLEGSEPDCSSDEGRSSERGSERVSISQDSI